MFFKKKKKSRFTIIKEAIDNNLEQRKFSMALALYSKLQEQYANFTIKAKEDYKKDFETTQNKLILLLKIQELINVSKTDNLEAISERLIDINDYLFHKVDEIPKRFYTYLQHHYSQAYKSYEHKIHKKELEIILEKIKKLVSEQNYDAALTIFPSLMKKFNKTISFKRNDTLAKELTQLKSHIKMSLMKQHAYSEIAKTDNKQIKKDLRKKIKKATKKKEPKIKNLPEDPKNKDMERLRKLIKTNKVDDSTKELEKIFENV